ncbi:MAG: thiamine-phosphate kinase [Alistipes sp.]|nr:thiamine-phosphate kinase [Alistipes sp.]MBR2111202.1 thiamine-phosphate kinase [Alistipes sp.]MBR3590925.1 thiamine-phosphate kinase [Alistipes sp.]MBR6630532.1 thiamine-phosphate kinase [Alistipes sp.]
MGKSTEIASLGEFGLIDRLTKGLGRRNASTLTAAGDDAAVIDLGDRVMLLTTDMLTEGIDFDLSYFPLKHLGYKAVVRGINDILAMNAKPEQLVVSLGVSAKISVEALDTLYEGMECAAKELGVDIVGGDTTASMNGLVINISAVGFARKEDVVYRAGAREHDLICITSNLGAAYMGLHLLEREKRVLKDIDNPEPKFEGYEYLLERYLKPRARVNVLDALREEGIRPTAMIDLSDGLASDLRQLCRSSQCGARIYLERIPIARQTSDLAEEMHIDPVIAALNGGEDHELLFTVPLEKQEAVMRLGLVDVIGHITKEESGVILVTPDGEGIALKAQAFDR